MDQIEKNMFSLFQLGNSIQDFNKKAEKESGLSLMQWCLLKHLIHMPASSAFALSEAVGVHPSSLSQTLKRLERKSYIFVTDDPNDSRRKLISITRTGKQALEKASGFMVNWSRKLSIFDKNLIQIQDCVTQFGRVKKVPL